MKFELRRGEKNAGVGRNIPWSNTERSGEMPKFMALTRGGGSFFYTVSPDPCTTWRPFNGRRPSPGRIYKLSALKGGGVLETRGKAYKHGRDRMMVHCIVFPHYH